MAFRSFQAEGTAGKKRPVRAMRDAFEVFWQDIPATDSTNPFENKLIQRVKVLVIHCDVSTQSTYETDYDDFIDQQYIDTPKVLYYSDSGRDYYKTYTGEYQIERITATDNQNGTTRITVALKQEDTWQAAEIPAVS